MQPTRFYIFGNKAVQPWLIDRYFAVKQGVYFTFILIYTGYICTKLGKTRTGYQAYIAWANHYYIHIYSLFIVCSISFKVLGVYASLNKTGWQEDCARQGGDLQTVAKKL